MSYISDTSFAHALTLGVEDAHYNVSDRGAKPKLFIGSWSMPTDNVEYLRRQRDNHVKRADYAEKSGARSAGSRAWAHLYGVAADAIESGTLTRP